MRYVTTNPDGAPFEDHFELGAGAGAALSLSTRYFSLSAGYAPSLTVSPLESTPRDVHVDHTGFANASASYGFRVRRASVVVSQFAGYTLQNSTALAVAGPTTLPLPPSALPPSTPPDGAPPDGGPAAPGGATENPSSVDRGTNQETVHSLSLRTGLSVSHVLSRKATLNESAGYSFSIGLGPRSRRGYPLAQGVDASVTHGYRLGARDFLTTALGANYAWSELRYQAQMVTLNVTWTHEFSRRFSGYVGAGVAYTRTQYADEAVPNSIYPTGNAGISYTSRLARGTFSFSANVGSAPVLDLTTAKVDPQLGLGLGASWSRDRTAIYASAGSVISVTDKPDEVSGALNSINATAGVSYDLGAGFTADSGVRAFWLEYEDFESVPPSFAVYVGVSWGASVPLIEGPVRPTTTRGTQETRE